jgi:periplasmic protein TonB
MSRTDSAALMSTSSQSASPDQMVKTDHLSVRPTTAGPAEVHFQFEQQQKRIGGALGVSMASHAAFALAILLFIRFVPERVQSAVLPDRLPDDIVWLSQPGPGGGGGGGNKSPEPPKKAEAPGKEKITVPAVKEPDPTPEVVEEPPPIETLNIPARTMAADAIAPAPGVLEGNANTSSTGSGSGTGAGSGQGSGLGPGSGGGTGGGVYRPGNGVEIPQLIRQVKPSYTSEAMRAKVQGVVLLECVVQTDGGVGNCSVQKSLDQSFGLDQEAIKAARQWRFRPGTRLGEPVPVLVTIELTFTLR